MRIAYIAPYQGPALVKRRPIVRNLSLAGRVKMERIAELLQENSHDVEILSQGEVIERQPKVYPGFSDPTPFHEKIPVYYSSALPVRFLNGLWSSLSLLRIFKARHRIAPYDVVLIYNLKPPQVTCARYAMRRLCLPVILEYEDDAFVSVSGKPASGFTSRFYRSAAKRLLPSVSGCMGVSPRLLSQTPSSIPKFLLRGVVGVEIVNAKTQTNNSRQNWIVFSGTHYRAYGLEQLIRAWGMVDLSGWELHIAGHGELTATLERMARGNKSIVFHGLLNREQNARFLCSAKIGINPHDLSETPGSVFAFKIIEYLAADDHVISTPMGPLEPGIESGITYMPDNKAETIAATLKQVIEGRCYERTAAHEALQTYGPEAVSRSLDRLLKQVMALRVERDGADVANETRVASEKR
jgi:Glycosyl transferases group 1/Glycosyl transferase 4-like domain